MVATVIIPNLPLITTPQLTDVIPTDQGGVTYKVTNAQLQTLFGFSAGILPLNMGGTNAALVANLGGIVYSNATQLAILPNTSTSGNVLQSNAGMAPSWSTPTYPSASGSAGQLLRSDGTNNIYSSSTFPDTFSINTILYASGTTSISSISTANDGLLVTSNTGVPSILAGPGTTGQVLQSNSALAPSFSTAAYPSTTTINQILWSNSANTIVGLATANNGALITSAGGVPSISSTLPSAVQTNITALGMQSQALNMGGFQINNGATPTSSTDYATKGYVDTTALTGTSVYAASTTNLTVTQSGAGIGATLTNASTQATFALDGVNPPVNSNVLIKNLAAANNEGIYTVTNVGSGSTNWVLTRATTYDAPSEINNTGLIIVQNGSTQSGTAWFNSATIVTVDTTNFNYSQFGNIIFPISLAHGGTNANLTASNGGIFYSTASAGAILSGTSTAGQIILSGASTAPTWSTATFASTYAVSTILFASSSNVVTGLATANSSGLLTNGSGVPAWVTVTGTGAPVLANTPSLITPSLGAATATSLTFSPTTGGIVGTTTNDSAAAGSVGEYISSVVAQASAVSLTNNTARSITSINLSGGDWDVYGNVSLSGGGTTLLQYYSCWINVGAFGIAPDPSLWAGQSYGATGLTTFAENEVGDTTPFLRVSLASPATVYLAIVAGFSTSTANACGGIYARRVR